jgi:hypothetical protein
MGIAEHIKHIANQSAGDGLQLCIVKSIDEAEGVCECEPLNGGAPYFARLRALLQAEDKSPLIVPVKDSVVIVATFNKNSAEAFVIGYTDVEKVKILTNKGDVWLNGDNYGGLAKVKELVDKMNALENTVNDLIVACKSQSVALAPTGVFALAPFFASVNPLVPTQKKEIENPKVKHGDK